MVPLVLAFACEDDSTMSSDSEDRIAPEAVADLALAYDDVTDAVVFTWTAPHDDRRHGRVDRYEIRVAYAEPFDWELSAAVPHGPTPLEEGSPQRYDFEDPMRGRDLYAAIRAFDAADNEAPVGNIAHVRVPGVSFEATCIEAVSKAPLPGLAVQVTAGTSHELITDTNGRVSLADLAQGRVGIRIADADFAVAYHSLADVFVIDADRTAMYSMIEYAQPASPQYESILAILLEALVAPGSQDVIKRWDTYPIPWYAGAFVNSNGIDFRDVAGRAADRWNQRTGMEIFVAVDAPPAVGVTMQFLPRSQMGIQNGITEYTSDARWHPVLDRIRIVDDFADEAKLYSIMMHEFGHTIRLAHLPAGFIMFGGQPLPADITDDEVSIVRLMVSLPNDLDLAIYDPSPPR